MKSDKTTWVGVEAKKEGFPLLMRIRRLTPQQSFGTLFVVTWSYTEDHPNRLPSLEFYSKLEQFEQTAIEEMERERLGLFVASATGLGKTRYYLYICSTESLAALLDKWISVNESIEYASDDDQEWREYTELSRLIADSNQKSLP